MQNTTKTTRNNTHSEVSILNSAFVKLNYNLLLIHILIGWKKKWLNNSLNSEFCSQKAPFISLSLPVSLLQITGRTTGLRTDSLLLCSQHLSLITTSSVCSATIPLVVPINSPFCHIWGTDTQTYTEWPSIELHTPHVKDLFPSDRCGWLFFKTHQQSLYVCIIVVVFRRPQSGPVSMTAFFLCVSKNCVHTDLHLDCKRCRIHAN